jgi:hypothetical protein
MALLKTNIIITCLLMIAFQAHCARDITEGDVLIPLNPAIIGDFLDMNYEFNSDASITVGITCYIPHQFFEIRFSNTTSNNTDVWTFEIVNNEVIVGDYFLSGSGNPLPDTDKNGSNNLMRLGYEITDTYTIVKFKRAVDTGDEITDKVINRGGEYLNFYYLTAPSATISYNNTLQGAQQGVYLDPLDLVSFDDGEFSFTEGEAEFNLDDLDNAILALLL